MDGLPQKKGAKINTSVESIASRTPEKAENKQYGSSSTYSYKRTGRMNEYSSSASSSSRLPRGRPGAGRSPWPSGARPRRPACRSCSAGSPWPPASRPPRPSCRPPCPSRRAASPGCSSR
uniref:Uncharacterized protein n=1 Tax=Arundo donax TaxID=35708 RepID=A0A0A9GEW6_ARUDO